MRGAAAFNRQDFRVDLCRDLGRHLVLQRQQIAGLPVKTPGPDDLVAITQIDEPQGDAKPPADPLNQAVQDEIEAKRPAQPHVVAALLDELRKRSA